MKRKLLFLLLTVFSFSLMSCDGLPVPTGENPTQNLEDEFGTPTYVWNEDNSECTATVVSKTDDTVKVTETVKTTSKVEKPTCEGMGKTTYTATFTNKLFEEQTKVVELVSLGHSFGDVIYKWKADYSSCEAKQVCANDESHIISEVATSIVNRVEPTATAKGTITYSVTFDNPDFAAKTHVVDIPALGHSYGEVSYEWNADFTKCTATKPCTTDATLTVKEEVTPTVVTVQPTCEDKGSNTYTATFANEAFAVQTKTVELPALGHSYGEANYEWASDYSACTASIVCANDAKHVISETKDAVVVEGDSSTTYTVSFENSKFEEQVHEVKKTSTTSNYDFVVSSEGMPGLNYSIYEEGKLVKEVYFLFDNWEFMTFTYKYDEDKLVEVTVEDDYLDSYGYIDTATMKYEYTDNKYVLSDVSYAPEEEREIAESYIILDENGMIEESFFYVYNESLLSKYDENGRKVYLSKDNGDSISYNEFNEDGTVTSKIVCGDFTIPYQLTYDDNLLTNINTEIDDSTINVDFEYIDGIISKVNYTFDIVYEEQTHNAITNEFIFDIENNKITNNYSSESEEEMCTIEKVFNSNGLATSYVETQYDYSSKEVLYTLVFGLEYNEKNYITSMTYQQKDNEGNVVGYGEASMIYNESNQLLKSEYKTYEEGVLSEHEVEEYEYDENGNETLNSVSTYDNDGNMTNKINHHKVYDENNNVILAYSERIDSEGNVEFGRGTKFEYDEEGNVTYNLQFKKDSEGNEIKIRENSYEYEEGVKILTSIQYDSGIIAHKYIQKTDSNGNIIYRMNINYEDGEMVNISEDEDKYDDLDRIIESINYEYIGISKNGYKKLLYEYEGNEKTPSKQTYMYYDKDDNLYQIESSESKYDELGRQIIYIRYEYDLECNLLGYTKNEYEYYMESHNITKSSYSQYDKDGNELIKRVDLYEYDENGNVISNGTIEYENGVFISKSIFENGYDENGNSVYIAKRYDENDELISKEIVLTEYEGTVSIKITNSFYDSNDVLYKMEVYEILNYIQYDEYYYVVLKDCKTIYCLSDSNELFKQGYTESSYSENGPKLSDISISYDQDGNITSYNEQAYYEDGMPQLIKQREIYEDGSYRINTSTYEPCWVQSSYTSEYYDKDDNLIEVTESTYANGIVTYVKTTNYENNVIKSLDETYSEYSGIICIRTERIVSDADGNVLLKTIYEAIEYQQIDEWNYITLKSKTLEYFSNDNLELFLNSEHIIERYENNFTKCETFIQYAGEDVIISSTYSEYNENGTKVLYQEKVYSDEGYYVYTETYNVETGEGISETKYYDLEGNEIEAPNSTPENSDEPEEEIIE